MTWIWNGFRIRLLSYLLEILYDLNLKWIQNQTGVLFDYWYSFLTVSECVVWIQHKKWSGFFQSALCPVSFRFRGIDWAAYKFWFGIYKKTSDFEVVSINSSEICCTSKFLKSWLLPLEKLCEEHKFIMISWI